MLSLLLQLNGDLPERFPVHERRLYVLGCRRKLCRRKDGSIRGIRATRISKVAEAPASQAKAISSDATTSGASTKPPVNLGESLFGVKSPTASQVNPFATSASASNGANPFSSASSLAAKPAQKPADTESLPQTFAEKARISTPDRDATASAPTPAEPWPEQSAFPEPYPSYHLDADKEWLESEPAEVPSRARMNGSMDAEAGSSSAAEEKALFESSMDKTFQRFADRLAQNPEQVLRYEFAGQPLLYSKTDTVGKLLAPAQEATGSRVTTAGDKSGSRMPRCANCGAERVFELQLTPHAITELEVEETTTDGMEWGTIILGVCSADCLQKGSSETQVGYVEEWVGVQWEELTAKR